MCSARRLASMLLCGGGLIAATVVGMAVWPTPARAQGCGNTQPLPLAAPQGPISQPAAPAAPVAPAPAFPDLHRADGRGLAYLPAPQTEDEESWMPVRRVRVTQDSAVIPGLRIGDLVEDGCGFVAGGRQEIHLPDGRVFVATVDVTHCGNGSLQVVHDGVTSLALQIYDCNIEDDVYAVFRGELLQYDFIYLRPALYLHIFGERLWKADGSYTLYPDDEPSDGETASIRREAIDHLYLYDETARGWLAIQQTGSLWTLLASPPHDPVAPGSCPAQLTVGWSAP